MTPCGIMEPDAELRAGELSRNNFLMTAKEAPLQNKEV
jgi:hypothetical protein